MTDPPLFNTDNPYGYQLNINHPYVRPRYERYKVSRGIQLIPSDAERLEFESYMIPLLLKNKK